MRFAIGSDHAGFALKQYVKAFLVERGEPVHDVGTADTTPVDYPDHAEAVAAPILTGDVDRGVLICGSGVGASVAANKIPGIRAGLCHDTYSAHQGVEHDSMNILVLGGTSDRRGNGSRARSSLRLGAILKGRTASQETCQDRGDGRAIHRPQLTCKRGEITCERKYAA
jgi:RpiB/LacA/LacB family sugar-phosphate isomerase